MKRSDLRPPKSNKIRTVDSRCCRTCYYGGMEQLEDGHWVALCDIHECEVDFISNMCEDWEEEE